MAPGAAGVTVPPAGPGRVMRGIARANPYRTLIPPALLAVLGFAAHAVVPGGAPEGMAIAILRIGTGIGAWVALAWVLSRLVGILLHAKPRLLSDLISVGLFAAAAVIVTQYVLGWPATGLIATSSVMLAVLGFALRNIFSDVFAGIALGLEHPFGIGDWIETTDGRVGRVIGISWRATRLVTREGTVVTVPNGQVAGNRLINYGSAAAGRYMTSLRFALESDIPVERAKRILLAAALEAGRDWPDLDPDVLLADTADGAAIYAVRFHVPDYGAEPACRDAVGTAVLRALVGIGLELNRYSHDVRLHRAPAPPERPRREALMRSIDMFRPFTETERAYLAGHMREIRFRPGDVVMRHGEGGSSLFVLGEGALDVRIPREDGEDVTVARLTNGAVFGEMSLVTGAPRSATVVAVTDVVAFELGRKELNPVLRRRPALMEGIATIVAERQARNAEQARAPDLPPPAPPPTRDVLLAKLRAFFDFGAEEEDVPTPPGPAA